MITERLYKLPTNNMRVLNTLIALQNQIGCQYIRDNEWVRVIFEKRFEEIVDEYLVF